MGVSEEDAGFGRQQIVRTKGKGKEEEYKKKRNILTIIRYINSKTWASFKYN